MLMAGIKAAGNSGRYRLKQAARRTRTSEARRLHRFAFGFDRGCFSSIDVSPVRIEGVGTSLIHQDKYETYRIGAPRTQTRWPAGPCECYPICAVIDCSLSGIQPIGICS